MDGLFATSGNHARRYDLGVYYADCAGNQGSTVFAYFLLEVSVDEPIGLAIWPSWPHAYFAGAD